PSLLVVSAPPTVVVPKVVVPPPVVVVPSVVPVEPLTVSALPATSVPEVPAVIAVVSEFASVIDTLPAGADAVSVPVKSLAPLVAVMLPPVLLSVSVPPVTASPNDWLPVVNTLPPSVVVPGASVV